jgi:hypothetical protein
VSVALHTGDYGAGQGREARPRGEMSPARAWSRPFVPKTDLHCVRNGNFGPDVSCSTFNSRPVRTVFIGFICADVDRHADGGVLGNSTIINVLIDKLTLVLLVRVGATGV